MLNEQLGNPQMKHYEAGNVWRQSQCVSCVSHHIDVLTRPSPLHLWFDRPPPHLPPFHNNDLDLVEYLRNIRFGLSKSQNNISGDRNCMFHSLVDLSVFKDHFEARHLIIVTSNYETIENWTIFWDDTQPLFDWIEAKMT